MSARRVGQRVFDWVKIASRVPEEAKVEFSAFRARNEACRASLAALPEKPEPINWDYYQKNIATSGLVENFRKQFEAVSVPYPKDTYSDAIVGQQQKIEAQAQEAIAKAAERVKALQKELDEVKAQKPYEDMTIDEYLADKPELRKQVEEDTKNHVWYMGKE